MDLLKNFVKKLPGASDQIINELQNNLNFTLPSSYIEVFKEFNGGEGQIGENSWLQLFSLQDLIEINKDYRDLMDQIPEYFLFAKDAADTGYAFNKENGKIYSFGLMSDFGVDPIIYMGDTFKDFLQALYELK